MPQNDAERDTRPREGTSSERRSETRARRLRTVRRSVGATLAVALLFGIGIAASAGHDMLVLMVETLALLAAAAVALVVAFAPGRVRERTVRRGLVDISVAPRRRRAAGRRFASALALVALFSAGAALSAAGGDIVIPGVTGTDESTSTETDTTGTTETGTTTTPTTTTTETQPGGGAPPAAPSQPEPPASGGGGSTPPPATPPAGGSGSGGSGGSGSGSAGKDDSATTGGKTTSGKDKKKDGAGKGHVLKPKKKAKRLPLDPEANAAGFAATIWLHRELPDPTPPAKRLAPEFASHLEETARAAGIRWSLVLGVLRARGDDGRTPATPAEVEALVARLVELGAGENGWRAVVRLENEKFAQRAIALSRYNRAARLWALVHGLEAAKPRLERRVLRDKKIEIYAGGRADIAAHRIDVRVLVLVRYLRIAHREVYVSSLFSGHGFFSRPGVPSAHMSGLAVDIAMLNGKSITGNQEPGGLTERAVNNILLLPAEVKARQVISLLGLGGASFPMGDHHDHIHVGY